MYLDVVEVLRPSPGHRNPDGSHQAGAPVQLYRGAADVQFRPQEIRRRSMEGRPEPEHDARVFLPLGSDAADALFDGGAKQVRINDRVNVEPRVGEHQTMRVTAISPLDTSLILKFAAR